MSARSIEQIIDKLLDDLSTNPDQDIHGELERAAGKARQITIPETFTLGIPVFQGGTLWEVKARLLWSVSGGNLQIGYKLQRPDLVYREAIDEIAETIEEAAEVYFGSR